MALTRTSIRQIKGDRNAQVCPATVVVAGAPLLALGLGTETAWADTSPTSTDTSATRQRAGTRDLAISVAGIPLVKSKSGTSEAFTLGTSIAIAYSDSQAGAMGWEIISIATNNSYSAAAGLLNTAIADRNSDASAGYSGVRETPPSLETAALRWILRRLLQHRSSNQ